MTLQHRAQTLFRLLCRGTRIGEKVFNCGMHLVPI
jgi:hypothetical protein